MMISPMNTIPALTASAVCAAELALSGTSPLRAALPAMAGVHALIGIGEALITCAVLGYILKVRPDLIYNEEKGRGRDE